VGFFVSASRDEQGYGKAAIIGKAYQIINEEKPKPP
jgi:hypothetical protein